MTVISLSLLHSICICVWMHADYTLRLRFKLHKNDQWSISYTWTVSITKRAKILLNLGVRACVYRKLPYCNRLEFYIIQFYWNVSYLFFFSFVRSLVSFSFFFFFRFWHVEQNANSISEHEWIEKNRKRIHFISSN